MSENPSENPVEPSTATFPCPVCDQPVPQGALICPNPNCKVDLGALAALDTLPAGLYRAALVQIRQNRLQEALNTLDSALAYAPDLAEGWVVRGKLLVRLGRRSEALESFQRAINFQPGMTDAVEALNRLKAGENARRRRVRNLRLGLLGLALAVGVAAGWFLRPSPADVMPAPTTPAVEMIAVQFASQPQLAAISIKETGDGIILSGDVADETTRQWAISLAEGLSSGRVAADQLKVVVEPTRQVTPDPTAPPPDLAGPVVAALESLPGWGQAQITVSQEMGGIRLGGSAPSAKFIQQVVAAAGAVPGVDWVDSQDVEIVTGALQEQVTAALRGDERTASLNITVEQIESGICLGGEVPQPGYRDLAGEISRGVPGVEWVDVSGIQVVWQGREHIVTPVDTLISISQKYYGVWWMWTLIYDANRDQINDPRLIRDGIKLIIPDAAPVWTNR